MNERAIPAEAIEAAAMAWRVEWAKPEGGDMWRAALEAAAPHMLAAAWDEGRDAGLNGGRANPYEEKEMTEDNA